MGQSGFQEKDGQHDRDTQGQAEPTSQPRVREKILFPECFWRHLSDKIHAKATKNSATLSRRVQRPGA